MRPRLRSQCGTFARPPRRRGVEQFRVRRAERLAGAQTLDGLNNRRGMEVSGDDRRVGDRVAFVTIAFWVLFWTATACAAAFLLFMAWAVGLYGKHVEYVLQWKPLLIAETQPHRE